MGYLGNLLGGLGALGGMAGASQAYNSLANSQQNQSQMWQKLAAMQNIYQPPIDRYQELVRIFDWSRAFDFNYFEEFFAIHGSL